MTNLVRAHRVGQQTLSLHLRTHPGPRQLPSGGSNPTIHRNLRVWRAIKWSPLSQSDEDITQLLKDCDLGHKIHYNAKALSGGQKRKLQLAIGLVGGSQSMFKLRDFLNSD